MNKILLVAKISITENIYDCLEAHYSVQICEPTSNAVERMNKIIKPQVMIFYMSADMSEELIRFMKYNFRDIPIITVCRSTDGYDERFGGGNMHFMFKPVSNDELLYKVKELLDNAENEMHEDRDVLVNKENASAGSEKKLISESNAEVKTGENTEVNIEGQTVPEKRKILAIDDDGLVLRTIKSMLKDEYEVSLATNVNRGLDMAMRNSFDAILLDYEMPDIDGCTALSLFKINFNTKDIPVIFLTGVSDRERITEVIKLKPAAYILKPVDAEKIKQALKEILT